MYNNKTLLVAAVGISAQLAYAIKLEDHEGKCPASNPQSWAISLAQTEAEVD